MRRYLFWLVPLIALIATPAGAAEKIKIGFVTTLTTGAAVIGKDMQNAVELALDHIGRKMGPLDVELVYADDEFNPQKGKQATERLVLSDNVDIVAGYIWSNVLLASTGTVLDAGKILISSNAGPSPLAGERCHKNFLLQRSPASCDGPAFELIRIWPASSTVPVDASSTCDQM